MRWILWSAAAAALVLGGSMVGASAQGMGGMGGGMGMKAPDTKPRAYRSAKPAPRAKAAPRAKRYGYRSTTAGSCGQYKYWSKGACKDARTSPPSLK